MQINESKLPTQNNLLRLLLGFTLLFSLTAFYLFTQRVYAAGLLFRSMRWTLIFGIGIAIAMVVAGLLVLTWTPWRARLLVWLAWLLGLLRRLRWLNLALFAAITAGFCFLLLGPYGRYLGNPYFRLSIFWILFLSGGLLVKSSRAQVSWPVSLLSSGLFLAFGYRIASYIPDISTYPFTLNWSETSRYFYASLYFSESLYGLKVPVSVLHPSRYLMQAAAFLIPNSPLWFHRLWQVILWVATTALTAHLLARRMPVPSRLYRWLLIAWSFMFILIGPVYYHLQVPVILVLWGYDRQRPWRTLTSILLASAWAGISRINWFPVPGMLAATLYFLEVPVSSRPLWRYLLPPAFWVIAGTVLAFAAQSLYALGSGNPTGQFTSSFASDLLWYRLLPSPTYPIGVLPAVLIVSLPLGWIAYTRLVRRWRLYHPVRLLALAAMLSVLFFGGLVVSTKIGGGSNLHNLDAYLMLLLVIAAYFYFRADQPEEQLADSPERAPSRWHAHTLMLIYLFALPVYFTLIGGEPIKPTNPVDTAGYLDAIRQQVKAAKDRGGEILFITERQLLTFGYIDAPLVPDYEKVFLMEMAMADNPEYLGNFWRDLENQRFSLIISEALFVRYKGSSETFGEENDAWVRNVSEPVLCYYEPRKRLQVVRVQFLVPRDEKKGNCP